MKSNTNSNISKDPSFVVSVNELNKQIEIMRKKRDNKDYEIKMKNALETINNEMKLHQKSNEKIKENFRNIKLS